MLTGDLQTDNDARRLARYGFPMRQIVTGGTRHLDARMVERHLDDLGFRGPGLLLVENVGNLVCPSTYDLGEAARIVLLSVTEGEDKPLKYPGIFHRSSLMSLTKNRPASPRRLDPKLALENALNIHPEIDYIAVSSRTREGFDHWLGWLNALHQKIQQEAAASIA